MSVRYELQTGWPSSLNIHQRVSAYTRVDRVRAFKIGITGRPEHRWSEYYAGVYHEMVVLYETRSSSHVRRVEREMTDYFDGYADNAVAGGGGRLAGPPFYLYVTLLR